MIDLPPLRRILTTDDPQGEEALDLFEALFPPEELEPREEIRAEWAGSAMETWVFEESGKIGGVCRGRVGLEGDWCWIVHVGLRPDLRGRKWGAPLLKQGIACICRESPQVGGTLLEVERLEDATTDEDHQVRSRRLDFFFRLGARLLTGTYIQAAVRSGCPPVPLNLMWLPGRSLRPDERRLIESFYRTAFNLGQDHPYVLAARGLLPLSEALRV